MYLDDYLLLQLSRELPAQRLRAAERKRVARLLASLRSPGARRPAVEPVARPRPSAGA